MGSAGACLPLLQLSTAPDLVGQTAKPGVPAKAKSSPLSPEDEQLLDDLERTNFCFFWEQANLDNGLVKDRR